MERDRKSKQRQREREKKTIKPKSQRRLIQRKKKELGKKYFSNALRLQGMKKT